MTGSYAGKIEVTTPTVDGVQRYRVKDLGGIGGGTGTPGWATTSPRRRCTPG